MGNLRRAAALLPVLALLSPALPGHPARAASSGSGNPAVQFSTYLGGSSDDRFTAVAVDGTGAVLLVGTTTSTDFPRRTALQDGPAGGADAVVVKLASDGRSILWSTPLGGSGDDAATCVAVTPSGEIWVGGWTTSTDFPVVNPLQPENPGGSSGFLARISSDGTTLAFSTYLGGYGEDRVNGLALGDSGNLWVVGGTDSPDLPVTPDAAQASPAGGTDAFAARISSDGASLLYATYIGGSGDDEALAAAFDPSGQALLVGRTTSGDFPLLDPFQVDFGGETDGFVLSLADDGGSLRFSTFLGGEGYDEVRAVAVRGFGFVAVAGETRSPDFPCATPLQDELRGDSDGFLALLSTTAGALQFSTFLGGSGDDAATAVAMEKAGGLVVVGTTSSGDLPLRAAGQPEAGGGTDGFVLRIHSSLTEFAYASYFGGSGDDAPAGMVLDPSGVPVLAGSTDSTDLPLLSPVAPALAGGLDGFAAMAMTLPPAPAGLHPLAVTHEAVSLAWTDPTDGRATFELERRAPPGPFLPLASLPEGTTSLLDGAVEAKTDYAYRVRLRLDGLDSPWSTPATVTTPQLPVPAAPGTPLLEVLGARSVHLRWEDRSENEITFEVFRSVDGEAFAFLETLPPGSTETTDDAASPDRTLAYAVRAVGVSGPSPFSPAATTSTPATLAVLLRKGLRVDGARTSRDSLRIDAAFEGTGGAALDPMQGGIRIGAGAEDGPAVLVITPHAEGWKARNGLWKWKSPKGTLSRVTLLLDTNAGTLRLKGKRLELPAVPAGALRVSLRCGGEAGSSRDAWTERKPGRLEFRP